MKERSAYQQGIIKNYYENREALALQKLQELVTELYLAETAKKRTQIWSRIAKAMSNLGVPPGIAERILGEKSAELLARHVEEWLTRPPKRS